MINFNATSLRSSVARRIFLIFLSCAFLPFGTLVLVSYHQVEQFFDQRNQRQLREMAKLFGMDVFQRLRLLESSLRVMASNVKTSKEHLTESTLTDFASYTEEQWAGISLITANENEHPLVGKIDKLPAMGAVERKRLTSGKALISVFPSVPGQASRIFMALSINPEDAPSDIVVGEINADYLWGMSTGRMLPYYVQACVQDQKGLILQCSNTGFGLLPESLRDKIRTSAVGDVEWAEKGREYLASYWTIPLQFQFHDPGWSVILKASKEAAFASISELKKTFIFGILASAGLSILLAIFQIRKRLVPVEKLQEGTRRIAEQDFGFQVEVSSNDEFEDLAKSVNTMARQLGRQFHTLSTKAEIDRAVLSLLDTEKIVETILNRLLQIFPCHMASLTLFNSDHKNKTDQIFIVNNQGIGGSDGNNPGDSDAREISLWNARIEESLKSSRGMVRGEIAREEDPIAQRVAESKAPLLLQDMETQEPTFDLLKRKGLRSTMAAPLMVQDDVLGILAFYSKKQNQFTDHESNFLRSLTSQVALAIYNSQLFERTKRQARELEKANHAKDEFLGVMSHELRTPLNVIMGYLHMLQEKMLGDVNADQIKAIDTIGRHSNDLLSMIESIMETTKLEAGAVVIESQPVDLVSFLSVLESQHTVPRDKELVISWNYPQELPILRTDEMKLKRMLQNLIGNAIKFTEKGRVDITVRYTPGREAVDFVIADTGIGISKESQLTIFEMFRQLESSKTREYGGLGLGLYVVKKISTLLGASIRLESQPDVGTVFTVTFPVNAADSARYVA